MGGIDFRRLMDLVGEALEQPSGARESWLRERCEGRMLDEAISLVREAPSRERLTNLLERRVADSARGLGDPDIEDPERIGNFRILERLGSGGMGVVYRAREEGTLDREVAIKLVRGNVSDESLGLRFDAERRLLARMDHPNIAAVYQADSDGHDRPFVVMELVQGTPLVEACDQERLPLRERMLLFLQVCDAVHHAHQRGVIHRDLKPTNILVTRIDDRLVPKVIDFGIAKMLDANADANLTSEGMLVGTLEYMSPEQSRSAAGDLDVRADIYSLGVLLYELSTGLLPFGEQRLRRGGLATALEVIQHEVPPLPSVRITGAGEAAEAHAAARGTTIRRLLRFLRGDLDWIIARALEKAPDKRYQSASELRADVERFLRNEPVEAGPPSRIYRMSRFVRRHRVGVLAGSAVAAALLIGTVVAGVGLLRAIEARDAARQEMANSRAVNDFLSDMLTSAKPENARGEEVTILQALEAASRRLEEDDLGNTPLVEASVRFALGDSYQALGEFQPALEHLERAGELYAAELPPDDERLLATLDRIGMVYWLAGDLESSLEVSTRILEIRRETVGESDPAYSDALGNVANTYADMGDLRKAEELSRQVVALDREAYSTAPGDYLCFSLNSLATILADQGEYEEAVALHEESLALRREHMGDPSPAVVIALINLGFAERGANRLDDARHTLEGAVAKADFVYGRDHLRTSIARTNLATVLLELDEPGAALPLAEEAVRAARASLGEDGWRIARSQIVLGRILLASGDLDRARVEAGRAYEQFAADLGPEDERSRGAAATMAEIAVKAGNATEAAHWTDLAGPTTD